MRCATRATLTTSWNTRPWVTPAIRLGALQLTTPLSLEMADLIPEALVEAITEALMGTTQEALAEATPEARMDTIPGARMDTIPEARTIHLTTTDPGTEKDLGKGQVLSVIDREIPINA